MSTRLLQHRRLPGAAGRRSVRAAWCAFGAVTLLAVATRGAEAGPAAREVASARPSCTYPSHERSDGALPAGPHEAPPPDVERFDAVLFPDDDLFRPLLADPRQPRLYASYRHVRFRGDGSLAERWGREVDAGLVGVGEDFGLFGLRQPRGCDGIQLSLFGAVFSLFDLDAPSADLVNTDFLVGLPITVRRGPVSVRMRVYHQSSHLGDEFLINNPGVRRIEFSFEAIDLLVSLAGPSWRLYAGGGALVHTSPDLAPALTQWGLELRGAPLGRAGPGPSRLIPVLGADFQALEAQGWHVNTSVVAGLEWVGSVPTRRLRLLAAYQRGFFPVGQFFITDRMEGFGLEVQLAF